ncbi:MAG TPA: hypothetical protein VE993_16995 [Stellaceae bacterium]|nr:hypothetical protein [Stellaceae bacterium]
MSRNAQDEGTDNVLADLGFPDADELTVKTVPAKRSTTFSMTAG